MADKDRPNLIDGFSSVQALRRVKEQSVDPKTRQKDKPRLPASSRTATDTGIARPGTRIGRTVVPTRYDLSCYECGYGFTITGRVYDTICPKCHKPLDMKDFELSGEWAEHIKTIGTVRITETGIIQEHSINARVILLAGNALTARLSCQFLELFRGAKLDLQKCSFKHLLVHEEAKFSFTDRIVCRDIDIKGQINARIYASETTVLRSSGFLRGELHTPSLVIEEGSGIRAKMSVGGDAKKEFSVQDTLNIKTKG